MIVLLDAVSLDITIKSNSKVVFIKKQLKLPCFPVLLTEILIKTIKSAFRD